jgi:hypothetical protein
MRWQPPGRVIPGLVTAKAEAGLWDDAERMARAIVIPSDKVTALAAIVRVLAAANRSARPDS